MNTDQRHRLPFWLHSRYVPLAGSLLAAAIVAMALGFMAFERRELAETALKRGELFARVLEDQANRTFNAVDVALAAAGEAALVEHANSRDANLSPLLQRSMQGLPFLRSISLLDAQGAVVASSNPANLGKVIHRQQLLKGEALAGLGPLLSARDLADLADSAVTTTTTHLLPLVRPVQAGRQGDWLVATLNPDYFANQYQLLLNDTAMAATLLSFEGQVLVPAEGSQRAPGELVRDHPVFSNQLANGREHGELQGQGLDGQPAYLSFRSARKQPLVVLIETPEAVVMAELRNIGLFVAAGTATLLLVLGGLNFLAWRSLRSHEAVSGDLQAARGSMAAQHAFTDRLFEVSPIPMVVKDADGRFLRINKAWTDFTGLTPDRLVGNNMGRLYPAQLAAPHEVQEQMVIASGQPVTYEEQMLDSDGLPRDVMIRLVPYTDVDGHTAGVIGCLMDVTEFREAAQRTIEAKEAAERSNAAKSEFLANISHELRTPLQSILGFSELGTLRARAEPRLGSMFGDIHGAGQRMLALVNNLLDLSRLDSTVGEIVLKPIAIDPTLRAVVAELQPQALARRLQVVLPTAPAHGQPCWALADAVRLQQVLRNVLANAIRFAPEGSAVVIDWRHDGADGADGANVLLISVGDHGPGIPPDELDSIFEAFVQSSRTKDGSGGTGLGLAICRKIMAAHHGQVTARNHPDGGAVFEIRLPAIAPPVAAAAAPAGAEPVALPAG